MPKVGNISLLSEVRNRSLMSGAEKHSYRRFSDGEELGVFVFRPKAKKNTLPVLAPGILFFHGGLWETGSSAEFLPWCMHFAERGVIALTASYRTTQNYSVSPVDALEDARAAVRWVLKHHIALGIDPSRLILAGGGAGAFMALCCGLEPESVVPSAIAVFSPVTDTGKKGTGFDLFPEAATAKALSPIRMVSKKNPPLFITHGGRDRLVPIAQSENFAKKYSRKKNPVRFLAHEAAEHSFYHFNVNARLFEFTLHELDKFLMAVGALPESDIEHAPGDLLV